MLTLGVDLAAQPAKTAACTIDWSGRPARILPRDLGAGLDDSALLALAGAPGVEKVAIDAPFGWPVAFTAALAAHAVGNAWPADWREKDQLVLRTTDRNVQSELGGRPLSVSASLLAVVAMRCAGLLAALEPGADPDRTGAGLAVEVYPAAALKRWGLSPAAWADDPGSYKGNGPGRRERRERLVAELVAALSGVVALDSTEAYRLTASDDHLDAFVCALMARASWLGLTDGPGDALELARVEGWIALPVGGLSALR